jgi:hypothetical protein
MRLRSGLDFAPYTLKIASGPRPLHHDPITTAVDVEPLLQVAVVLENLRFDQGEDDSEGLGVTSRPPSPSPSSENEPEDDAEQPHPTSGPQQPAKKRRNSAANKRRARKRVRLASSGHQPHTYAANPSTTMHHAEEQGPLRVSADAGEFPASGSGSWVGLRKKGAKKTPWTVSELIENGFTFIEWDGR